MPHGLDLSTFLEIKANRNPRFMEVTHSIKI